MPAIEVLSAPLVCQCRTLDSSLAVAFRRGPCDRKGLQIATALCAKSHANIKKMKIRYHKTIHKETTTSMGQDLELCAGVAPLTAPGNVPPYLGLLRNHSHPKIQYWKP